MTVESNLNVQGAGGGGSSHTPVESPNSLVSKTTARVLFLTSDGEVGGLADQTNKLKSVYFNNVPVMNADGSTNFSNVRLDERYGLPSQSVMTGYPSASNTFNIGTKITVASPVTYTSSTSAADAIRVTIRFPALFQQQTNGDTTGATVSFEIYRRLGAGSFSLVKTVTKTDKCTSPADTDYLIDRPTGAGVWSVRVNRVTADNSTTTLANDIYFQTAAEIQYAQLPYNNRAYLGMTVTAEATGSSYPLISFDTYGLKVKVPSNYNPVTRVYSGVWNGLFSVSKQVCDNPAWVLYDLLTNASHGMGSAISEADVDAYSFYDAAVYNDGLVPALVSGAISGTEPRYTFNYQLMEQGSAWTQIQNIAASMGAAVYTSGNRVRLVQDRPTNFSRIITNSNVVDGMFEYSSSQKSTRSSACIVFWNNPAENWLSVPCYYEDAAGTARYGLNVKEVTGLGITTEGQALRLAKWHVDTSLNNTDAVIFKVGFSNAGMEPGEVIKVMDTDFAQVMNEAKVVSSTVSSVTLDRSITTTAGNTFDIVGTDGVTVYSRTITTTGTQATVNFSGDAISVAVGADCIVSGAVSPRLFKVTNVKEESPGEYTVSAVEYDANKFGRVDSTPTGQTAVFQTPTQIPSAPLSLSFRETQTNTDNTVRRALMVSWSRPAAGTVKNYTLRYRRSSTNWDEITLNTTSYELSNILEGLYEVQVYARSVLDVLGPVATGSYTITSTGGGVSILNPPTNLQIIGGGTSFAGPDLNFQFTNPSSNSTVAATLRDFEVRFIETTSSTTVRTVYITSVASGGTQTASYTFAMNTADGGPRRSMQVQVRCRDANNNLSNPVTTTFNNPAPLTITPVVTGGVGTVFVTCNRPADPDFSGYLVWMSLTNGFIPSIDNLVYDGSDTVITLKSLAAGTHYLKFAAYDQFGKNYSGTGLNLSAELTATPVASAGIPGGSTLPGSGTEADLFFNTTDGQLYRYHSGAWTIAVPAANITGALSDSQLAAIDAAKIIGSLSDSQISAISAAKITGAITSTQITDNSITTAKIAANAITASQIAADTITASQIAANAITSSELAAGAVTAGKITAGAIVAGDIAAGTITGANIAAGTLTASNIAAGTLTANELTANTITGGKIAANTISGSNIAAGTITASNILANTITGDKIAANTITAGLIDSRGLSIKDAAGNVILSAGSALDFGNFGNAVANPPSNIDANAARGKSLAPPLAQWVTAQSFVTVTDGKVGDSVLRITGAGGTTRAPDYFPIDPDKTYRTRFWARPSATNASGLLYFCLQQFTNNTGTTGPNNGGRQPYKPSGQSRATHNAWFGTDQWGEYSYTWTAADWQAGVKFVRPDFLDNYSGAAGHWDIQDFTFEEVTEVVSAAKTAVYENLTGTPSASIANSTLTPLIQAASVSDNLWTGSLATITGNLSSGAIASTGYTDPRGNPTAVVVRLPVNPSYVYYRVLNQAGRAPGWYNITLRVYVVAGMSIVVSATDGSSWNASEYKIATTSSATPVWVGVSLRQHLGAGTGGLDVVIGSFHGPSGVVGSAPSSTEVAIADLFVYADGFEGASNANYTTYNNLTGTPAAAIANSSVSLSSTGVLSGAGGGSIQTVPTLDNDREGNPAPNAFAVGTTRQFKHSAAIGLGDVDGYYCTLETIIQYASSQGGGSSYQYAYQEGKTWRRKSGDAGGTYWSSWVQDLDTAAYTGSLNASSDITLISTNAITVAGNKITRTSGGGAWDAGAYSKEGYAGGCFVSMVMETTGLDMMMGLNSDPTTDSSYPSLDYAWYTTAGSLYVYESGSYVGGSYGAVANGDTLAVIYDGSNVRYFKNGVVYRTVAVVTSAPLHFDCSFVQLNACLSNIKIGPMSSNAWGSINGTGKPADNATVGATFGVNVSGQITAATASTYIANAAIGSAHIGSLNADVINAGTINAARIAVGTATVAEVAGNIYSSRALPVADWSADLDSGTVVTLTSSGGPVIVWTTVKLQQFCNVGTVNSGYFASGLYIDGVLTSWANNGTSAHVWAEVPSTGTGTNRQAIITLPIIWRGTLAAGAHTFKVITTYYVKSSGTFTNFGSGATAYQHVSMVAMENKI